MELIFGETLEDEPICTVHEWCQDKLMVVMECLDPEEQEFLTGAIQDVICAIDIAKDKGQRMENRLIEYKEAIEGLGFERVRKE